MSKAFQIDGKFPIIQSISISDQLMELSISEKMNIFLNSAHQVRLSDVTITDKCYEFNKQLMTKLEYI